MPILDLSTQEGRDAANKRDREYQAQFQAPQPSMASTMASKYPTTAQPNQQFDYRSALNSALTKITQPRQTFQYNAETDQPYQAAATAARNAARTAQANTNARLRASGQGKSSWSEGVANQIAQRAETDIATNIRPQYEQMAYNRYLNDQNAERQSMNDLLTIGQGFNTLEQQDIQNARADASLTGRYLPPVAQRYIDEILDLKRQAEGPDVTAEQMGQYRSRADDLRQQLAKTGVDPNIVGYESDYDQALTNVSRGIPTLQAQQFESDLARDERNFGYQQAVDQRNFDYKAARDLIADEQYKQKFDEDVRRFGLEYAMRQAEQANVFANRAADNARANASLGLTANNQELRNLYDIWDRTGVAPAGIPGVPEGTPLAQKQTAATQTPKVDAKESANNLSSAKKKIPSTATYEQAVTYAQNIADHLSDSDYRSLLKWIDDEFGG